ncbi:MAG: hypothetical protein AABO58_00895 [Acidobacteriota bacterium]
MTHPAEIELDAYAADPASAPGRAVIEAHVAQCGECREYVARAGELESMARDRSFWDDVDGLLVPPRRLDEALGAKAAIEADNLYAARRLGPLLRTPLRFLDADVANDPALRTPAAVRMLCGAANAKLNQWPKFSLALATAAYKIAEHVEAPAPARNLLRAIARREQANAFRYLGPLTAAMKALDDATALFEASSPAEAPFELAIVDYIRSVVLVQFDETTEDALHVSRRAIHVFRDYADESRELSARLVEAMSLHHLGRATEALAALEILISEARRLDQKLILAHGLHNAAMAHTDLGLLDEAERYNAEAVALFDEFAVETEKVVIAWDLARIAVRRGDLAKGVAALDLHRRELLQLGLKNDHALATLDWAEGRLQLGQPEGVAEACREVMMEYEAEGMRQNARVALGYVHQALAAKRATPALIRDVRGYLARLPRRPNIPFMPAA